MEDADMLAKAAMEWNAAAGIFVGGGRFVFNPKNVQWELAAGMVGDQRRA